MPNVSDFCCTHQVTVNMMKPASANRSHARTVRSPCCLKYRAVLVPSSSTSHISCKKIAMTPNRWHLQSDKRSRLTSDALHFVDTTAEPLARPAPAHAWRHAQRQCKNHEGTKESTKRVGKARLAVRRSVDLPYGQCEH